MGKTEPSGMGELMTIRTPGSGCQESTAASRLPLTPSERIREADECASVAHDFIWGRNGVTKKQASDAIWRLHAVLRPLYGEQGGD